MEVHHTHTARKKWSHYLFEFFMLFLAVFCGFLAEYRLEHVIEHNRAKAYAKLLIDDLSADTLELNKAARVWNNIITAGDSLSRLLKERETKAVPGGKLYYYEYWSGWSWNVNSRNNTLQQLTNSGALRYMGDTSLIRKILDYDESIRIIYLLQDKYYPEKAENWKLVQNVFDQVYFDSLELIPRVARDSVHLVDPANSALQTYLTTDYPLMNPDKTQLLQLSNWARNSSRAYRVLQGDIITAKQKAFDVIRTLKKNYHL